jgi:uncharacterized delta-60 repeat protein
MMKKWCGSALFVAGVGLLGPNVPAWAVDGDLDPTFAPTQSQYGGDFIFFPNGHCNAMARQSDGKYVMAGYTTIGGSRQIAVARITVDGALDTTFDTDGIKAVDINSNEEMAHSVAIKPDGKILVAGISNYVGTQSSGCVVQLNSDGSVDTTFGAAGSVLAAHQGSIFYSLVIHPSDGRIFVGGKYYAGARPTGQGNNWLLGCLNSDGTVNTSFGTSGWITRDFAFEHDEIKALALQPIGTSYKLVAVGTRQYTFLYDLTLTHVRTNFAISRYLIPSTGASTLDSGFGTSGTQVVDFNEYPSTTTDISNLEDVPYAVVIQRDRKIVITGVAMPTTGLNGSFIDKIGVARLTADGLLDTSFDGDGKFTHADNTISRAVALQSDDKIVLTYWNHSPGGSGMLRLLPNGSIDTTFGLSGTVALGDGGSHTTLTSLVIHKNLDVAYGDKLVPAGYMFPPGYYGNDWRISRFITAAPVVPVNVSLGTTSGSSSANSALSFTATYKDPNGSDNIRYAYFQFNDTTSNTNSFLVYYDRVNNKLYLRNDANTAWLGGFAPGSANTISNTMGTLNCAAVTVSSTSDTLTVNWNLTPSSAAVGTNQLSMYVRDMEGNTDGWDIMGTWNISGGS